MRPGEFKIKNNLTTKKVQNQFYRFMSANSNQIITFSGYPQVCNLAQFLHCVLPTRRKFLYFFINVEWTIHCGYNNEQMNFNIE